MSIAIHAVFLSSSTDKSKPLTPLFRRSIIKLKICLKMSFPNLFLFIRLHLQKQDGEGQIQDGRLLLIKEKRKQKWCLRSPVESTKITEKIAESLLLIL